MRNIAGLKPTNKVFGYILGALFVIAAVAVLLGGCGTDEITGGNGNPPVSAGDSLIFSVDSFTIKSNDITRIAAFTFKDTTQKSRKYKVIINASSNVPASADTAFCDFAIYTTPGTVNFIQLLYRNEQTNNVNINNTYNIDSSTYNRINCVFDVGFKASYPVNPQRYISVKKFQLYLVN